MPTKTKSFCGCRPLASKRIAVGLLSLFLGGYFCSSLLGVTLELQFNDTTFTQFTSGTFRLSGMMTVDSFGDSQTFSGGAWSTDYYTHSSFFNGGRPNGYPTGLNFLFNSTASTGTLKQNGVTHQIYSPSAVQLNVYGSTNFLSALWIYTSPNLAYGGETLADTELDISGTFSMDATIGSNSPDSQGASTSSLEGQYLRNPNATLGNILTISVPEPSALSLLLAGGAVLIRRRRS